jgi:hypothetical protein
MERWQAYRKHANTSQTQLAAALTRFGDPDKVNQFQWI